MGIKHFFNWFRTTYNHHIDTLYGTQSPGDRVETLALDLNGIFHPATQKAFGYGAHAPDRVSFGPPKTFRQQQARAFREILGTIDGLVARVRPTKRLLLCVDGVAGSAKMAQQRQRRFRREVDTACDFDSNAITPGTEFMHSLEQFLLGVIGSRWSTLEVVFSGEKVPGEGEAKIFQYLRESPRPERVCVVGMDADLVMLALCAAERHAIWIFRQDSWDANKVHWMDVSSIAREMQVPVEDFVFLCFLVGNDFLPPVPGLEIKSDGIDILLRMYREACPDGIVDSKTKIPCFKSVQRLFRKMLEQHIDGDLLHLKYRKRSMYHRFPALEESCCETHVDMREFRERYYAAKLPGCDPVAVSAEYLRGLQWVIQYYTLGMPCWSWRYPYYYAPLLVDLADPSVACPDRRFPESAPCDPFLQLLSVLPPSSARLLPPELGKIMETQEWFPESFQLDFDGKKQDWEAIALLPWVDPEQLREAYGQALPTVRREHLERNRQRGWMVFPKKSLKTAIRSENDNTRSTIQSPPIPRGHHRVSEATTCRGARAAPGARRPRVPRSRAGRHFRAT